MFPLIAHRLRPRGLSAPCRARLPLHRKAVRPARSMLLEFLVSPAWPDVATPSRKRERDPIAKPACGDQEQNAPSNAFLQDMIRIVFTTRDGQRISGYRFDASDNRAPNAGIVIAPGMAIPQSFYVAFARHLAAQGYAVWTFDYRGTGESLVGSMRGVKASLTDWYARDYDAMINVAADANPGKPVFAIGHSFGGQSAPLLPSRARLAGLVNIAVGSGAMRHNQPNTRRRAPFLWYGAVPLLCPLFGRLPRDCAR